MKRQGTALFRFGMVVAAAAMSFIIVGSAHPSAAIATPGPTADAPSIGATTNAAQRKPVTVQDILRTNPTARQVRPNAVNVAPGIDVLVAPAKGDDAGQEALVLCDYYYLCVWEHAYTDGFGAALGFYDCQPSGTLLDLGGMRYPDGAWVGTGASGAKWNDRISSFENNQSSGTRTIFYNYTGSWTIVLNSYAFSYEDDMQDIGLNDIIDGVHVCTS